MGISRESLGQIRNILRKLDDSIDSVREKRLEDNERSQQLRHSEGAQQRDPMLDPNGNDPHNMSQRIG
jgi:hypothetical protein